MLMIIGAILILVGFAMLYRYLRNSRRPRIEVKIDEVSMEYARSDHKEMGPKHRHAHLKYNFDGVNYTSKVLILKRMKENDWIEVSVNPKNPEMLDIYAPQKEKIAIVLIFVIGIFLIAGSWWILDYFDAW